MEVCVADSCAGRLEAKVTAAVAAACAPGACGTCPGRWIANIASAAAVAVGQSA